MPEAPSSMSAEPMRRVAMGALAVTTACNVGFLLFDPRNPTFDLWLAALFLAGGAGYAASLILVARRHRMGYVVSLALSAPSAVVVAFDNLGFSAADPVPLVFALNLVFFLAQAPLALACMRCLRILPPREGQNPAESDP